MHGLQQNRSPDDDNSAASPIAMAMVTLSLAIGLRSQRDSLRTGYQWEVTLAIE